MTRLCGLGFVSRNEYQSARIRTVLIPSIRRAANEPTLTAGATRQSAVPIRRNGAIQLDNTEPRSGGTVSGALFGMRHQGGEGAAQGAVQQALRRGGGASV